MQLFTLIYTTLKKKTLEDSDDESCTEDVSNCDDVLLDNSSSQVLDASDLEFLSFMKSSATDFMVDGVNGAVDDVNGAVDDVNGAVDGVNGAVDGVNGAVDGGNEEWMVAMVR